MKVIFVRHGKDDNKYRGGWSKIDLIPEGIEQAKQLANHMKENSQEYHIQREYPKVCVNLQTGVRYNYSVWRFLLWQEEKVTHHRKQQCAK